MDVNVPILFVKEFLNHLQSLHIEYKDLTGKIALVTGGNDGIGFYTAVLLAKMSCKVIIASRNVEKSELAVERIKTLSGNPFVESKQLDLGNIASVNEFIKEFFQEQVRLDLLINNAGSIFHTYGKTDDGYERNFHVNYLGPFILTIGLVPLLAKAEGSRIVNVSTFFHKLSKIDPPIEFNTVTAESYNFFTEYTKSKLYNLLFTRALSIKLRPKKIMVVTAHPGFVQSNIGKEGVPKSWLNDYVLMAYDMAHTFFARKGEQGAMTSVFAATSDRVVSGGYYDSCVLDFPSKQAKDVKLAEELFDKTLQLVKLKFEI